MGWVNRFQVASAWYAMTSVSRRLPHSMNTPTTESPRLIS